MYVVVVLLARFLQEASVSPLHTGVDRSKPATGTKATTADHSSRSPAGSGVVGGVGGNSDGGMGALPSSGEEGVADLGSLLIGFLKFFGDRFDPRETGLSVRRKCYFARAFSRHAPGGVAAVGPVTSPVSSVHNGAAMHGYMAPTSMSAHLDRRHSFQVSVTSNVNHHNATPYPHTPCMSDLTHTM